jgi:8-amino-7-oxononanoate synthase
MSSFEYLQDRLAEISRHDRRRRLVPRVARGVWLSEPGSKSGGRELINFGSNDYLGLAAGRDVPPTSTASGATSTGSGASALVCGWSEQHQVLADQIAELESTESAVLFPTGFAACSGAVATLADEGDLILSDRLNHASLIDGCRLSRATRLVFPHRDCDAVQQILQRRRGEFARVWIVTDAVFSMDGHLARLPQLCDLAEQYDATVIADEAHGTGVFGRSGSGLCEELGVKDRVPIRIGTLSKAIGSQGGFVAAPRAVTDYLVNRCRSLIYSTALAPAAVAAATSAIDKIMAEPERRVHLHRLAWRVREGLSIEVDPVEARGPIIPVPMGADRLAVAASERLAEEGFFVPAIRPPTVPEGGARLRISLSAAHDDSMIDALVAAINDITPH